MNLKELSKILNKVTNEQVLSLTKAVDNAEDIFLIGNGGSNAIASHMAVDYMKFLKKKCFVPNATDLVTMMVNDYGTKDMYSQFVDYYADQHKKQLAILISSSGNSVNIINAANRCSIYNIPMILLSGFKKTNDLNSLTYPNILFKYWVNSTSYGVVEMAHHSFLHSIV
jgi:D-sedoheptulose 7-phosphate isomerase